MASWGERRLFLGVRFPALRGKGGKETGWNGAGAFPCREGKTGFFDGGVRLRKEGVERKGTCPGLGFSEGCAIADD